MLLEKVEEIVSQNLNVIKKEVKKEFLHEYDYEIEIGNVKIKHLDNYVYLTTSTLTYLLLGSQMRVPFTTFNYQTLYYGKDTLDVPNEPIKVSNTVIGYKNTIRYLHLPDFIFTQVLYKGINAKSISKESIIEFQNGKALVYKHGGTIYTPYYSFAGSFDYDYELANDLGTLIGVFDAYKRGLITSNVKMGLYYLFFPFVSMILYRDLETTLFPLHTHRLVRDTAKILEKEGEKVLNYYTDNTLQKLNELIAKLNGKTILN